MSDRIGFKKIFYVTHCLATPSLVCALFVPGNWVHAGAFLSGIFVLATLPLGVIMAHQLAPKGRSLASSLMMGLAFGTGGMLTPITGKLADLYSIRPVLMCVAFIPLLTVGLATLLPEKKKRN
jgi:FSR family fosmidomycin resistance protein-like MFS transporter